MIPTRLKKLTVQCSVTSVCCCGVLWVIQCICTEQHLDNFSGSPGAWEGLWQCSWYTWLLLEPAIPPMHTLTQFHSAITGSRRMIIDLSKYESPFCILTISLSSICFFDPFTHITQCLLTTLLSLYSVNMNFCFPNKMFSYKNDVLSFHLNLFTLPVNQTGTHNVSVLEKYCILHFSYGSALKQTKDIISCFFNV